MWLLTWFLFWILNCLVPIGLTRLIWTLIRQIQSRVWWRNYLRLVIYCHSLDRDGIIISSMNQISPPPKHVSDSSNQWLSGCSSYFSNSTAEGSCFLFNLSFLCRNHGLFLNIKNKFIDDSLVTQILANFTMIILKLKKSIFVSILDSTYFLQWSCTEIRVYSHANIKIFSIVHITLVLLQ